MSAGAATLALLPALCLLSGASWAATLGGLGGECNRRRTKTHEGNTVIRAEVIYILLLLFYFYFDRLNYALFNICLQLNRWFQVASSSTASLLTVTATQTIPCTRLERHLQLLHSLQRRLRIVQPRARQEKNKCPPNDVRWRALALNPKSNLRLCARPVHLCPAPRSFTRPGRRARGLPPAR